MILNEFFDFNKKHSAQQGVAEVSRDTLKSYQQKVSADSMKHPADPTKRSQQKANRSVAGFAKAQNRLEQGVAEATRPTLSQMYKVGWNDGVEDEFNEEYRNDPEYKRGFEDGLDHAIGPKGYGRSNPKRYKLDQGVAEGLNEFAPPGSGDNGNDGFSEETLKRLAAQWYNGDEDPRVEQTLMAAGWEIGQDEGYDDEPGVFVVQAGDVNGNSYISWPAHELKQGVAEGAMKDLHIDLQDQQWDAIVGYVVDGLKNNMDIGRMELNLYQYAGQEMFDVDQELQNRGFRDLADLAAHIQQNNGRYVPPKDFDLGKGVAEGSGQDSFVQRLGRKLQQSGYTQTEPGTWSQGPDGRYVAITPLPDGRYGWELRRVNRRGKWYSGVDTEEEVVRLFFKEFNKDIFSKDPVDEGLAEVSDSTKQSYKAKSQAQVQQLEPHAKKGEYRDIAQRAIDRRQRGLTRLAGRADAAAAQTLASRVSEGLAMPEGLPALGEANITKLIQTYKRNEPFVELSFGNSGTLEINRKQMRLIMDHYIKLPTPEKKHDFVYKTMSHMLLLIEMFDGYRRDGYDVDVDQRQIAVPPGQKSPVPGAQPQLFELDAGEVKDTRLSRALKQARAEFPTAGSDIEAFLKLVMSNDDRDLAAMNRMQAVNKKQSELLDRIQNIDQKQNQEIGNLESELDRVTAVNQNLERELNRIQSAKPAAAADREPRKDTAEKPAAEKPAARVDLPVGQDISAKAVKKTDAQLPSKVSYGGPTAYKTTLQPPKYSMPQLQAPAQAQLPAPTQQQRGLFPDTDITDVIPRAVAPSTNGIKSNPVLKSLDQEITGMFQPAANDDEAQRQANAESRDPKRAIAHIDFDSPEWHEKVRRVGQRAKQGPLKTVWDEKRKVFRNVPVDQPANNNPNMNEARLHRRAVLRQILES